MQDSSVVAHATLMKFIFAQDASARVFIPQAPFKLVPVLVRSHHEVRRQKRYTLKQVSFDK